MMDEKLLKSSNIANYTSKTSNNNSSSSTNSSNTSGITAIATATSNTISAIPAANLNNNNKMTTATVSATNPSSGKTTENRTSATDQPQQQQQQQQHLAMKCPRCDSSNTKFCYYNNYSLSQPRHFCKACKRYWTRGGTLRNVPVGGGCRKNKRVKKPAASVSSNSASVSASTIRSDHLNNFHTLMPSNHLPIPTSSHLDASMLFALQNSTADISLALPGLHIPHCTTTAFDLQPALSSLGLGFSSHNGDDFHQLSQLSQLPNSSSPPMHLLSDYSLFCSSFTSNTAALLASSMKPHNKKIEDYQTLFPYDELQEFNNGSSGTIKQVKLEAQSESAFNNASSCADDWEFPHQNSSVTNFGTAVAPIVTPSDSSSYLYWNSGIGNSGWSDSAAANCGTSVAHLI